MKVSCDIITDLIPLVKDKIASGDSQAAVLKHVETCDSCRAELEMFPELPASSRDIDDKKLISNLKRNIFMTQITVLLIGAVVGIALTDTMGMFYNLLIMPLIGAISYFFLKRKWFYLPIVIFVASYTVSTIGLFIQEGFRWEFFYNGYIYLSLIYAGLVILGVIIAVLLKFAFRKEEEK